MENLVPFLIAAVVTLFFLVRYLRTRTLVPFGAYCLAAGLVSLGYLTLIKK